MKKKSMTETQIVLAQMLTENTGKHWMDSGGEGGRHWQQNQGKDFLSEPETVCKFEHGNISVLVNVFHFLDRHLEYDADATRALRVLARWMRLVDKEVPTDMEVMHAFSQFYAAYYYLKNNGRYEECRGCHEGTTFEIRADENGEDIEVDVPCPTCGGTGRLKSEVSVRVLPRGGVIVSGLSKGDRAKGIDGDGNPLVVNTYNEGDDLISQTLQFVYFTLDYKEYVVLQTHNGADVRGGYSAPRVFQGNGLTDAGIFQFRDAHIGCTDCARGWHTDDGGSNWYPNDSRDGGPLHQYATKSLHAGLTGKRAIRDLTSSRWEKDFLCYLEHDVAKSELRDLDVNLSDDDIDPLDGEVVPAGTMFCPACSGILKASI